MVIIIMDSINVGDSTFALSILKRTVATQKEYILESQTEKWSSTMVKIDLYVGNITICNSPTKATAWL